MPTTYSISDFPNSTKIKAMFLKISGLFEGIFHHVVFRAFHLLHKYLFLAWY